MQVNTNQGDHGAHSFNNQMDAVTQIQDAQRGVTSMTNSPPAQNVSIVDIVGKYQITQACEAYTAMMNSPPAQNVSIVV